MKTKLQADFDCKSEFKDSWACCLDLFSREFLTFSIGTLSSMIKKLGQNSRGAIIPIPTSKPIPLFAKTVHRFMGISVSFNSAFLSACSYPRRCEKQGHHGEHLPLRRESWRRHGRDGGGGGGGGRIPSTGIPGLRLPSASLSWSPFSCVLPVARSTVLVCVGFSCWITQMWYSGWDHRNLCESFFFLQGEWDRENR